MSNLQTLLAVDFDARACDVYRANFPGVDVRCSTVGDSLADIPDCDIIMGGPPCQSFSTAGLGKGEHDERDGWPEFCNAVEAKRPRMFLAENVPGMMAEKHLAYVRKLYERLTLAGYIVEIETLDAVNYGAPQFRKRVWFWGIRRDVFDSGVSHCWPKPTHAWPWPKPGLFGESELLPAVTAGQALEIAGYRDEYNSADHRGDEPCITIRNFTGGSNVIKTYRWSDDMLRKHPPASPASPAPTVLGKYYKGGAEGLVEYDHGVADAYAPSPSLKAGGNKDASGKQGGGCPPAVHADGLHVRRLTYLECARLQSCPDDMAWPENITKTAAYRVIGNGWSCAIAAAMGRVLQQADPESRTIVDLFCGGGLGSMGIHQRYWQREATA